MTPTPPDPAHDPGALAGAEDWARAFLNVTGWHRDNTHLAHLLAEYDQRGERIAALLAVVHELVELQAPESELPMPLSEWQTRWENAWTDARRALLGEERP